jgi:hypothetical protein
MKQAIGRSRRYGQTKRVHIYHFLTLKTIDVDIFQQRYGKTLVAGIPTALAPDEEPFDGFKPSGFQLVDGEKDRYGKVLSGEFVSPAYFTSLGVPEDDDDDLLVADDECDEDTGEGGVSGGSSGGGGTVVCEDFTADGANMEISATGADEDVLMENMED